jgi:predicted dehydrogenase
LRKLKLAVIGSGFWARYQIAAWMEFNREIEVIALYNRTVSKAWKLAEQYGIPHCYDTVESLLSYEEPDFVDIITEVSTHEAFTKMAAKRGIPVICQKPMADSLRAAQMMLKACHEANIPLYIHENFRWQKPIRKMKELLTTGIIGKPFKARVIYCSAFPVFENQPSLAEVKPFILTDIGSHIFDVCRFLFGEAKTIYCQASTVNKKIRGEDVANVLMKMQNGIQCFAEMSYASILEHENFPQTLMLVEGEFGSISLNKDFEIKVVTKKGVEIFYANPVVYEWADPLYAPVHSSIVDCNRNILDALQGKGKAETTGEDNMKTVGLVWAAYESATQNKVISMQEYYQHKIVNMV